MFDISDIIDIDVDPVQKEFIERKKIQYVDRIPWIEKYRPKKLFDIMGQEEAVKMSKNILKTGTFLHLLFFGPPGTGKTSTILAIAKELFGPKVYRDRILELNASDERGINVVRNKVISFSKMSISTKDPNYLCPPFKIVILDEADAMTVEAQSALRKVMEDYSKITRFCFICNYRNKMIDPIISRCAIFRFKPLDQASMCAKIVNITQKENIILSEIAIKMLIKKVNGDMRKLITLLQNVKYSYNFEGEVDDKKIYDITNNIPLKKLSYIINKCIEKESDEVKIIRLTQSLMRYAYSVNNILAEITEYIAHNDKFTDSQKSLICYNVSIAEHRLIEGSDEYLQLLNIMLNIKYIYTGIAKVFPKIDLI